MLLLLVAWTGVVAGVCSDACLRLPCPRVKCGCTLVRGLGARKKQVVAAGGPDFLASAMMETVHLAANYSFGDGKRGDAFNAGIAKQNWFMARTSFPPWRSLGTEDYLVMAVLNVNLTLDALVYEAGVRHYGLPLFLAGHRDGKHGLLNPHTPDIERFIGGFNWTRITLSEQAQCVDNDVRYWVDIPAI